MKRRSIITTVAATGGLALGIVFSPVLGTFTANAQTQPPAQTTTAVTRSTLQSTFLDKLAAGLGLERTVLDGALKTAGLATVDDGVQQGTLTTEQATEMKTRIENGQVLGFGGGRGGHGDGVRGVKVDGLREAMVTAAAQTLNITVDELNTQLQAGQTVAQIAQAHGTTEEAVTTAALTAAKTTLAAAVQAGTITQEQADTAYTRLEQQGANILTHGGGRGGRGSGGADATPDAPAAPQATPSGL